MMMVYWTQTVLFLVQLYNLMEKIVSNNGTDATIGQCYSSFVSSLLLQICNEQLSHLLFLPPAGEIVCHKRCLLVSILFPQIYPHWTEFVFFSSLNWKVGLSSLKCSLWSNDYADDGSGGWGEEDTSEMMRSMLDKIVTINFIWLRERGQACCLDHHYNRLH